MRDIQHENYLFKFNAFYNLYLHYKHREKNPSYIILQVLKKLVVSIHAFFHVIFIEIIIEPNIFIFCITYITTKSFKHFENDLSLSRV